MRMSAKDRQIAAINTIGMSMRGTEYNFNTKWHKDPKTAFVELTKFRDSLNGLLRELDAANCALEGRDQYGNQIWSRPELAPK